MLISGRLAADCSGQCKNNVSTAAWQETAQDQPSGLPIGNASAESTQVEWDLLSGVTHFSAANRIHFAGKCSGPRHAGRPVAVDHDRWVTVAKGRCATPLLSRAEPGPAGFTTTRAASRAGRTIAGPASRIRSFAPRQVSRAVSSSTVGHQAEESCSARESLPKLFRKRRREWNP